MIQPAFISGTVPITDLIKVRAASGRLLLPSNQPYFVRFEHISGIPSVGNGAGYSISKLRILDTLVDRLAVLKGERREVSAEGLSEEGLDSLIGDLKKYLHASLQKAAATPFGIALGAGEAENGQLFNLFA